jgi:hypothetical protein
VLVRLGMLLFSFPRFYRWERAGKKRDFGNLSADLMEGETDRALFALSMRNAGYC